LVGLTLALTAQLAVVARAPIDTSQGVNFHALISPDTVYVGQQATYQVGVFIDDQLRLRLRHNPEFIPPDAQGMLSYELAGISRLPEVRHVGHRLYEVHVFERAFFPLAAGRYNVPSAQLVYSLPLSTSFFSREETHTLVAESLTVIARAPPLAGRPPDYVGAVGDVTIAAHLDSVAARVGDPMLLTLSIEGRGNVKLFPRPAVALSWGTIVPGEVRVRLDTTAQEVRGTKEFDWLITPHDSGQLTLPPVRYPYFDPYSERYEIAATSPSAVHVGPGSLAPADTARTAGPPPLPVRRTYAGPPGTPFYDSPLYLALVLSAPLPAIALAARRRPRKKRSPARVAGATLRGLARADHPVDAVTARRAFARALEERFTLPPTVLTDRGALTHALRLEGVTAATAEVAESVLAQLDRGAFGVGEVVPADVCARAYAVYRDLIAEARPRRGSLRPGSPPLERSASTMGLVLAVALTVSVAGGASAQDRTTEAATAFAAGVKAYAVGNYRAAAAHFATAAEWTPAAAEAWVNAGTAAWAAGDTADAVVGWQRAGRLVPLDHDVRDRLALVRAPQDGPIARLPRVPASLAADIALACWILACSAATWRAARGQSVVSAVSVLLVAGTVAAGVTAIRENESAAARHLAVVDRGVALYASPALDADHVGRVEAGDVARTVSRQGVWTHVQLDGDRDGWIETGRLISIEQR
jgi:hypothetical protein